MRLAYPAVCLALVLACAAAVSDVAPTPVAASGSVTELVDGRQVVTWTTANGDVWQLAELDKPGPRHGKRSQPATPDFLVGVTFNGEAANDVVVRFECFSFGASGDCEKAGGKVNVPMVVTDDKGHAKSSFTMGTEIGSYFVTAYVSRHREAGLVRYEAILNEPVWTTAIIGGDRQVLQPGETTPLPLEISEAAAEDPTWLPPAGSKAHFVVTKGDPGLICAKGADPVKECDVVLDKDGHAGVFFQLDTQTSIVNVHAAGQKQQVAFTVELAPDPPSGQ